MNPIFAVARVVQAACQEENHSFCFIGGLAVQRWGEPRLTLDVDLVVLSGFGGEEKVIDSLLRRFRSRIEDGKAFALDHRVLLLESDEGIPVDVSLGAIPFEERVLARSSAYLFEPGLELLTCGAEDLIVLKTIAGREKDWLDIEGIVARQGPRLDLRLIWEELEPLLALKEDTAAAGRLRDILRMG